jgi:4-hydroxy-2-oxoheptanedioate aldolase
LKLALENVEAIAATSGLNALMLGPGDLQISLGLPSKRIGEYDDPKFLAAVDRLIQVSKKYHKALMTVAFKVSAKSDTWLKHFSLLMTSADILSVTNGHRTELANAKKLLQ